MQIKTKEKYHNFEISWLSVPSFIVESNGHQIRFNSRHGIELHYKEGKQKCLIGFIEGYEWYHSKKGPCNVYILSKDSEEWGELTDKSAQILKDTKDSVYEILVKNIFLGQIKGNIYVRANA
jgi:hypothetical protein